MTHKIFSKWHIDYQIMLLPANNFAPYFKELRLLIPKKGD